jgi:hypothetical protein
MLNCVIVLWGAWTLVYLPGKEMLNVVLLDEGKDKEDFYADCKFTPPFVNGCAEFVKWA